MMNKTEFEARVREKAELQKNRIKKQNKIIKIATAVSGTVVAAACVLLIMTKVSNISNKGDSFLNGAMNGNNNEMMNEAPEINEEDNIGEDGDIYGGGFDNIGDSNSSGSLLEEMPGEEMVPNEPEKNEVIAENSDAKLFAEINSMPDSVRMFTYPATNNDGMELSENSRKLFVKWLQSLKLKNTGNKENDKNGLLYEFELVYQNVTREVYVFDNMICVDNGTWFEFNKKNLVEFENLIKDISE